VCPQVRRIRVSPHRSGRVIAKQASEVFGQAQCRLPELQVPHAPWPAEPHGPQAVPQQNQEVSPVVGAKGSTSMGLIESLAFGGCRSAERAREPTSAG
jgi:hypothetical protein